MNAAMPELRSAVMIVVEVSWEDASKKVHAERARMEDKSSGGACLRLKSRVNVGDRLLVQWRFEQFSGLVKYCRDEGGEFVVGMQRDRGPVEPPLGSSRSISQTETARPVVVTQGKINEFAPMQSGAARAVVEQAKIGQAARKAILEAPAAVASARVERASGIEERRSEIRDPVAKLVSEKVPTSEVLQECKNRNQHEVVIERKPMKHKWLDLAPWNHKQQGPSVGSNGGHMANGGRPDGKALGTEYGSLAHAEGRSSDAEAAADAGFPADLLSMDDVYLAAGVMQPRGRGVHKVIDMLRSEHVRGLSEELKRAAVLMALEVAGVTVYQIQRDAKARQDALDAYEAEQKKQAETQWARKEEENGKIQADMERVQAQYMARIARNLKTIALEQSVLRNWQTLKQQESLKIAEAVDICIKPVAVATSMQAHAGPVMEKVHAAVVGAEGAGGVTPS
jgi:hypothetical protein